MEVDEVFVEEAATDIKALEADFDSILNKVLQ